MNEYFKKVHDCINKFKEDNGQLPDKEMNMETIKKICEFLRKNEDTDVYYKFFKKINTEKVKKECPYINDDELLMILNTNWNNYIETNPNYKLNMSVYIFYK